MALDNHSNLGTKTLSAPNPISTVYKYIAFFDAQGTNKIAFTHPSTLEDLEIQHIDNSFDFTSLAGITIRGSLRGQQPSGEFASDANTFGDVSQLFKDMYGSVGQNVDLATYQTGAGSYPAGAMLGDYAVAEESTAGDKGIIYGLREEAAIRNTDIGRLNSELDGVQELFYGTAWAYDAIDDDAGDFFKDNVEPSNASYLINTQHLNDALGVLDVNLARNNILIQGLVNQLSGSEGAGSPPYTDFTAEEPDFALESNEWDGGNAPSLLDLGSDELVADGSRDTFYMYSAGMLPNTRPKSGTTDQSQSTNLANAMGILDNELRREEIWGNKLGLYLDDGLDVDAASTGDFAGALIGWAHDSNVWASLSVLTGGTFQELHSDYGGAGDSISLRDALNNLDVNMRILQYKVERNKDHNAVSPDDSISSNVRRESLGQLRVDFDNLQGLIGAGNTQGATVSYASGASNTYLDTNTILGDLNQTDVYLENLANSLTGAPNDSIIDIPDWTSNDVEGTLAEIHNQVIQDTHSIITRLGKVVDASSNIEFASNAKATSPIRVASGQGFTGGDPYGDGNWGYYAVNKNYVDAQSSGLLFKPYVHCVAESNKDLNGGETVDGHTVVTGQRVLCVAQTAPLENGVYDVDTSGDWTRSDQWEDTDVVSTSWTVWVKEGTNNENQQWNVGGAGGPYTIGADALIGWTKISRQLGLKSGQGTTVDVDRTHLNEGKSIYNDGSNGSTFDVFLAGSSGATSGAPHNAAWTSGGVKGNSGNPIAWKDGSGTDRGLFLKYGTAFALSGSGELTLAESSVAEATWAYNISEFAESVTSGENSSGGQTPDYWDAAHWLDLRNMTGPNSQASELKTTGHPNFENLSIDPDGTNNGGKLGVGCDATRAAFHVLGTAGSNTVASFESDDSACWISFIDRDVTGGYPGTPNADSNDIQIGANQYKLKLQANGSGLTGHEASKGEIYFQTGTGGSGSTKMVLDEQGRLGIGPSMTSPDAALHIDGTAGQADTKMIIGSTSRFITLGIGVPNDDVAYIACDNSDEIAFGEMTNDSDVAFATEWMRIDNNGNVGIGTDDPSEPLHVSSPSANPLILERTGSPDNVSISFKNTEGSPFYIGKGQSGGFGINDGSADLDDASNRLWIADSGEVGIGTINPKGDLDVQHTGHVDMYLRTDTTKDARIFAFSEHGESDQLRDLKLYARDLRIETGTSGTSSGSAQAMLINHTTGNVSIGTNDAHSKLHIQAPETVRPLSLRREDVGELIRWNYGATIVGGITTDGVGTGIYAGNSATNAHIFIKNADGNIGFGTENPTDDFSFERYGHGSNTVLSIKADFDHNAEDWADVKDDNPMLYFRKTRMGGGTSTSTIGKYDINELQTGTNINGDGGQLLRYFSDTHHVFSNDGGHDVGGVYGPTMIITSGGRAIIGHTQPTPTGGVTPEALDTTAQLMIQKVDTDGNNWARFYIGKTVLTSSYTSTWDLNNSEMIFGHDSESRNIKIMTDIGGTPKGMTIAHTTGNTGVDGSVTCAGLTTDSLTIQNDSANIWSMKVNNGSNSTLKVDNADGDSSLSLDIVDGALKLGGDTKITNGGTAHLEAVVLSEGTYGITLAPDSNIVKYDNGSGNTQNGLIVSSNDVVYRYAGSNKIYLRTTGEVQCQNIDANSTSVTNEFAHHVNVDANITATGDVIAYSSSDERLKRNKRPICHPLDKINSLSGVMFDWDEELQDSYSGTDIGVLAQEVEEVVPQIVTTRDDGYKAVKYEKLVPLLIEAVKELSNEVKELKGKCKCH